jgi:lipoyl(octanoyl) transferase
VQGRKIAALGLRVRGKRSYHGLSLNVRMDLEPFSRIDPCGYRGMEVTQITDLGIGLSPLAAGEMLAGGLAASLGYNEPMHSDTTSAPARHG